MIHQCSMKKMINCTLVGDGMVGKTSLARVFAGQNASEKYEATVFNNFAGFTKVGEDQYTVNIFDSAGEHEYTELRCFCYKDSEVFVVCYSVNDRDSFESVRDFWIPEIKKFLGRKVRVILVATQTDTDFDLKADSVSSKEGQELARTIRAEHFVECSRKVKGGVLNMFDKVAVTAIKRRKRPSFILRRVLGT